MSQILLPYPITEVENGVLLYYLIYDPSTIPIPSLGNKKTKMTTNQNQIKYQFISHIGHDYCLFNDIWAVPLELFEKIDFKRQNFLYFMRYGFDKIYSELVWVFEINEDFIINYKAFKTFVEYKKLEKETKTEEEKLEIQKGALELTN
jgi:hypothetical protein